jgi:hypothetical protein
MLVVLSDTHRTDGTGLVGAAASAVAEADAVVHAGDFTSEAVLENLKNAAGDAAFTAVHGNADSPAVTERLPTETTVEYAGIRIALTHQNRSGATGLAMLGRQQGADLVISGHTHRPTVEELDHLTLLNPGSHADPRGARQSFAVLEPADDTLSGELRTVDGDRFARFTVSANEE